MFVNSHLSHQAEMNRKFHDYSVEPLNSSHFRDSPQLVDGVQETIFYGDPFQPSRAEPGKQFIFPQEVDTPLEVEMSNRPYAFHNFVQVEDYCVRIEPSENVAPQLSTIPERSDTVIQEFDSIFSSFESMFLEGINQMREKRMDA